MVEGAVDGHLGETATHGRCATFGRVCGRPCQSPMPADEHGPLTGKVARSGSPVEKHTEASVCDDDILNKHPI